MSVEKLIRCTFEGCDKTFTRKSNMTRHLKLHYGIKPFNCDFCGKSFARKSDFQAHKLSHAGRKPFKCSWKGCEKSFVRNSDKTAHEKRHLQKGKNPFQQQKKKGKNKNIEKFFFSLNLKKKHSEQPRN